MKTLARNAASLAALILIVLAVTTFAQQARLPEEDWYGETKKALRSHYLGKSVRARLAIPATGRGLELLDGERRGATTQESSSGTAQPGEELIIQNFKVTNQGVELTFNRTIAPPARSWNPFGVRKQPRLRLRFARELTSKDLTIENINRWLATAIDVNALTPTAATLTADVAPVAEKPAPDTAAPVSVSVPEAVWVNESPNAPALSAEVGELTIEADGGQARIYIDDAYSGLAPRTVRLRAGLHTVSVLRPGQPIIEQRLLIAGGKAATLRVGTSEAVKR
jgi:hypothetical protein